MPDLEIIGVPFSNYVRSVRILCAEKGVAHTLVPARPHTPEVLAIHPAGQIPAMRHGDLTLFETKAIATYIDKAFPGPRFIPDDPVGAARVEQWVSYGNAKVDKWIMREFVVPQAFVVDKAKGPDMARVNAAVPEIEKCLKVLDEQVAKTGHLAGAFTYADMHVLPMLVTLQAFPKGKEIAPRYAALMAYVSKLTARDSFKSTEPPPRK